jgi:hypothetical protein
MTFRIEVLNKFLRYLQALRSMQRVNIALSRGAATSALRVIDITDPRTWEFSGFSQNGEDGIIDVLTTQITQPNRYFVEIGASDGIENNTTWLAVARRYSGIWVEGGQEASDRCAYLFTQLNYGVESVCMFVTRNNIRNLKQRVIYENPDVLSLDIDGNDYYLAKAILQCGLRPKIFILEYNSAFGPTAAITIPYREDFQVAPNYRDNLYYGSSVSALRKLASTFGYKFVTVDTNGVNAIFIDPGEFDSVFVSSIKGINFAENFSQLRQYRVGWEDQFDLIKSRDYVDV